MNKFKRLVTSVTFWIYLLCALAFIGVGIYVAITDSGKQMWINLGACVGGLLALNITLLVGLIFKIKIPAYIHIYVFLLITLCVILGQIFTFFDDFPWFNKVLHGSSGALLTMIGFSLGFLFMSNNVPKERILFITIFAFCFSLAVGVIWEIFEFSIDSLTSENMQRWQDKNTDTAPYESGLVDTMWDIIVHTAAALVITIIGFFYLRRRSKDNWFKLTAIKHIPTSDV
ncbi:MAG: hypothetical protein FWE45_00515 [Firmicutes bacterium]|nr:hypothetical protein [Bacillota bacterium]